MIQISTNKKGFTLVELMVAISIFVVVITISMGSILSVFAASQKSKTLRSVMDNMNITLESMTRTIRFGTNYHCGSSGNTALPLDCGGSGDTSLTVKSEEGKQVTYSLVGSRIAKSVDGGTNYYLTSPDVTVSKLVFRVYGSSPWVGSSGGCSSPNDCLQPEVIVVVSGSVGVKASTKSTFTLETTASQRQIDFQ